MGPIDWLVVVAYLSTMLGVSARLSRRQQALSDYFLGGRQLRAGAVGISVLATQSSAISFISIPAFVALRPEGGLRFLQYELALPAAMAALALWLIPALRRSQVYTIYEYLEQRFDRRVRRAVAALFLVGRGLATGVSLYATGLLLEACLNTPLWCNLLGMGAVTVGYDLLGGLTAVVYSDVIQMAVLILALGLCIGSVLVHVGGPAAALQQFPTERYAALADPVAAPDSLWAYLLGGFFLYASYYGCDQSQTQRLLATRNVRASQQALLLNGLARFPLILAYCTLGIAAWAALAHSQPLQRAMVDAPSDTLVPQLIRLFLPEGIRGLVFAGLIAAAMSSLDSALNALAASSVRDFGRSDSGQVNGVGGARTWTLVWGVLITGFAFVVGDISKTVIEAINKVGSVVYGPVLAIFLLALPARRCSSRAAMVGLGCGLVCNLILWLWVSGLHFLWWNPAGCGCALGTALLAQRLLPDSSRAQAASAAVGPARGPMPFRPQPVQGSATTADQSCTPADPSPLAKAQVLGLLGGATLVILATMGLLQALSLAQD